MTHRTDVVQGQRFEFGKNWKRFLRGLNEGQIKEAEESLREMLEVSDLSGNRFLDVGSGSGIFSLAARRLGARVHSFDYDPESVGCTRELKRRYFCDDPTWTIEEGSVLDANYLSSLGKFDVVYSWGVLHHTGKMWQALENASLPVIRRGRLFIAIYNDMGWRSRIWRWVKKTYNVLPRPFKTPFVLSVFVPGQTKALLESIIALRPRDYIASWTEYRQNRGMSRWHDAVDWIGGYPYEVAKPEELAAFFQARGFQLAKLKRCDYKLGCNEMVFVRGAEN